MNIHHAIGDVAPSAWQASMPAAEGVVMCTLPMPPSINRGLRDRSRKGRERRDWEGHALWHLKLQKLPIVMGEVILMMGFERPSKTADADNRGKYTQDILVTAGVIEDDRHVQSTTCFWLPSGSAMAHVAIIPAQTFAAVYHPSPEGAAGAWVLAPPPPMECP